MTSPTDEQRQEYWRLKDSLEAAIAQLIPIQAERHAINAMSEQNLASYAALWNCVDDLGDQLAVITDRIGRDAVAALVDERLTGGA